MKIAKGKIKSSKPVKQNNSLTLSDAQTNLEKIIIIYKY